MAAEGADPTPPVLPEPVRPESMKVGPPGPAAPESASPAVASPEAVSPGPTGRSVAPPPPPPVASVAPEDPLEDPLGDPLELAVADQSDLPPRLGAERERYVAIRPPRWRGTGMLVAAGVVFAHALTFQGIDSLVVGNVATGGVERALMATTVGLAAGGAAVRAHADAYDDTALRRRRPETRRMLIAGATLAGVGAAVGLVNEGLWWRCAFDGSGPYRTEGGDFFDISAFDCRYGISRGLLDLSTGATSVGLAMMTWALVYRRDARAYQRARVVGLRPTLGRDRWGLSIEGRF